VKRLAATLALAVVALAAAACSTTNAGEPGAPNPSAAPANPDAIVITARDMAFVPSEVVVPAGKPFELTFENKDGAPHNVAIYTDASASQAVYRGEIVSATTRVEAIPALAAGTYAFRCDVHPDMKGTIVAR
jgi:plastocyanin